MRPPENKQQLATKASVQTKLIKLGVCDFKKIENSQDPPNWQCDGSLKSPESQFHEDIRDITNILR